MRTALASDLKQHLSVSQICPDHMGAIQAASKNSKGQRGFKIATGSQVSVASSALAPTPSPFPSSSSRKLRQCLPPYLDDNLIVHFHQLMSSRLNVQVAAGGSVSDDVGSATDDFLKGVVLVGDLQIQPHLLPEELVVGINNASHFGEELKEWP